MNKKEIENGAKVMLSAGRSCSNCKNYQPDTHHLWCRTSDYSVTPIEILADEIKIKTDCNEKRWSPC
jgi:hypothetical protein